MLLDFKIYDCVFFFFINGVKMNSMLAFNMSRYTGTLKLVQYAFVRKTQTPMTRRAYVSKTKSQQVNYS